MDEKTLPSLPERAALALASADHEIQLLALAESAKGIDTITNKAGREECHGKLMEIKSARVSIEKTGKAAREDATAFSKAVIAEEKRLISLIEPAESRLAGIRDKWDAAREAERAEAARIEAGRISAIKARIDTIRRGYIGSLESGLLKSYRDDLSELVISTVEFAEFSGEAMAAKTSALADVNEMISELERREAVMAKLEEERAELERVRKQEQEELALLRAEAARQAKEAEEKQLELAKALALQQAELDAIKAAAAQKEVEEARIAQAAAAKIELAAEEEQSTPALEAKVEAESAESLPLVEIVPELSVQPAIEPYPSDSRIIEIAHEVGMITRPPQLMAFARKLLEEVN